MTQLGGSRGKVVLVHGFANWPASLWPLAYSLRQAGYATLVPFYPSRRLPFDAIVDRLIEPVHRFAARNDGPLHFIGHSMGGLIIRAMIERQRPEHLGRVVMLGTPNEGSEIADMLHRARLSRLCMGNATAALLTQREAELTARLGKVDYPVGVIAGNRPLLNAPLSWPLPKPHDGMVSVASTHVEGETDHLILPLSHARLCWHRTVKSAVCRFLHDGRFSEQAQPGQAKHS